MVILIANKQTARSSLKKDKMNLLMDTSSQLNSRRADQRMKLKPNATMSKKNTATTCCCCPPNREATLQVDKDERRNNE